jgi:DNA-binding transcriptional regulator GbsR (MarR family)
MSKSNDLETEQLISILPPATHEVFQILSTEKPLCVSEIKARTNYSSRTVQVALHQLKQLHLICQKPDMQDMRRRIYSVDKE